MKQKVLLVDDSGLARRSMRAMLESDGFEVVEAEDGMVALERYFIEKPDAVLLDLVMKGMYGLDVLTKLRELDATARVIVVSADVQSSSHRLVAATQPAAAAEFEFGAVEEGTDSHEEVITLDADMNFASLAEEVGTASSPPIAKQPVAPAGKGIDAGLAELFEEFRSAEEEDSGSEDFETHYNMGTAYKEMDLIDEAIQEFQISVALVKPADGTSRFLQCCNMLGHCFVQKGMPEAAIMWFKKGLGAPGHSEDEYQALRYELGGAYEELGDVTQARTYYTEVYGVDVNYREVADKLSRLKQTK